MKQLFVYTFPLVLEMLEKAQINLEVPSQIDEPFYLFF